MKKIKVFPVVHHIDRNNTLKEINKAQECGADGIFIHSKRCSPLKMLKIIFDLEKYYPDFTIGIKMHPSDVILALETNVLKKPSIFWLDSSNDAFSNQRATEQIVSISNENPYFYKNEKSSTFFSKSKIAILNKLCNVLMETNNNLSADINAASDSTSVIEKYMTLILSDSTQNLAVYDSIFECGYHQYSPLISHLLLSKTIAINEYQMNKNKLRKIIENTP